MPVPGVRWGTSGHRSEVGPLQSQRVQHEEVVEVACRQQSKATVRLAASVSLPQGIAADLSSSCKTADRVACFTTACIRLTYRWNDYGVRRATSDYATGTCLALQTLACSRRGSGPIGPSPPNT